MTWVGQLLATALVLMWVAFVGSFIGMVVLDDPRHPVLSVVFVVSVVLLLGGFGIGIAVTLLSTIWRP